MPTQLLALTEGPNILIDKPIIMFGRHPECDVQLNSRKVSRRHCCVAVVGNTLLVRDLGSTNGIRINGIRVSEGKVCSGDELTIGTFRYQVAIEGSVKPAPPKSRPAAVVVPPLPARHNDSLLEEADEPIPLDEDNDGLPLSVAPPVAHPPHRKPSNPAATLNVESSSGLIIPDQITLLPQPGPRSSGETPGS